METKVKTIKIPATKECFRKIKKLYLLSYFKSSVSCLLLMFVTASLWHLSWENLDDSLAFYFIGLVIFCLLVTSIYSILKASLEIKSLSKKSDEFIRCMYVELVKSGDIKPIIVTDETN